MTEANTSPLPLPTKEAVDHALRDLEYAERFVGYGMTASAGNHAKSLYSLKEVVYFVVGTPWDAPMLSSGFKGSLNWVNLSDFVAWLRDVIGDYELAGAIEEEAIPLESYKLQSERVTELLNARMQQYREVHDASVEAAGAGEAPAAEADNEAVEQGGEE